MSGYPKNVYQKVILSLVLLLELTICGVAHAQSDTTVKLGILAKRGEAQTLQQWRPLAEYLNTKIPSHTFEIVPLGFDALEEAVSRAAVDFVLTNTVQYVTLEYRYGVSRIATLQNRSDASGQHRFGGVIFTRQDNSAIEHLVDLKGKRFGAVDPASFGGWVMAKKELVDHNIHEDDFKLFRFLHTHDAVVMGVLNGEIDAGTVRSDTLERMAFEGKINMNDIRIIAPKSYTGFPFAVSTALYPEWPFAKLSHTPDALAETFLIALLGITPELDVAQKTDVEHWTIPMDYSLVHDLLKTLGMPPYDTQITFSDIVKKYAVELIVLSLFVVIISIASMIMLWLYGRLRRQTIRITALNNKLTQQTKREHVFRQMIDSQTALTILGNETQIVECNQAFLDFFGIQSPDAFVWHSNAHEHTDETTQTYPTDFSSIFLMQNQNIALLDQKQKRHIFHVNIDRFAFDPSLFVASLVDITANEEMHQRLVLLQKAINQTNNTILISSIDGTVQYVNQAFCECRGYTETELLHQKAELLGTIGLNPLSSEALYNTLSEDKMWVGEVQTHHKNGCEHIVHITISPVKNDQNKITHLIAIGEDVSKYRQIEGKLKEKEQMLLVQSRFAAVGEMLVAIAHQWRQPLSIIQMSLENLKFSLALMEVNEEENIESMSAQVQFLSHTIDDFSHYFQKETKVEQCDFDTLACDATRLLEQTLKNNAIEIETVCHTLAQINTRRQEVVQVMLNLINNSKEALLLHRISKPKITIKTTYRDDLQLFIIEVIDNGGGVNDAIKHKIFEPYFSTKETLEGSGLGLYIAKTVVENSLKGRIGFENTQDGTRFYIEIPSLPQEEEFFLLE